MSKIRFKQQRNQFIHSINNFSQDFLNSSTNNKSKLNKFKTKQKVHYNIKSNLFNLDFVELFDFLFYKSTCNRHNSPIKLNPEVEHSIHSIECHM